jgi:hypothetical protein
MKHTAHTGDTEFRIMTDGTTRHLHPVVPEEAYRIAAEALTMRFDTPLLDGSTR